MQRFDIACVACEIVFLFNACPHRLVMAAITNCLDVSQYNVTPVVPAMGRTDAVRIVVNVIGRSPNASVTFPTHYYGLSQALLTLLNPGSCDYKCIGVTIL